MKERRISLLLLTPVWVAFCICTVTAQQVTAPPTGTKAMPADSATLDAAANAPGEHRMVTQMDSLLDAYKTDLRYAVRKDVSKLNKYHYAPEEVPHPTPEVVQQRLRELCTVVPLDYNKTVQNFIDMYTVRKRDQLSRLLGLQYVYFPIIDEIFEKEGMPPELRYVCVIESAFNTRARHSRSAATGMWQFMYGTARLYGMRIDNYVDEREDPVKSATIAARYLKQLYGIYNDWQLAIAAYNCGPGRVNRALRMARGKTTFWEIYNYLPLETRGYVPCFIAACYAMNYYAEHNVYPIWSDFTYDQDTLQIAQQEISLDRIAELTGTDAQLLADLNPELKLRKVPYSPATNPYTLRVPKSIATLVLEHPDTLYKHPEARPLKAPLDITNPAVAQITSLPLPSSVPLQPVNEPQATPPVNTKLVYYTVRRGDTYAIIAYRFKVDGFQLMKWNNATNGNLEVGQALKVYLPAGRMTYQQPAQVAQPQATTAGARIYKVQFGDTLWGIAQRYSGITIDQIRELNNLQRNATLKPGMVLRLPS